MDSLTQITLGAAVGEAVLGKKVGNRAMLWGAIAGTVPDLDVVANFFLDDMGALAFHRGITHSLLFAAVTPLFFGWATWKFYHSSLYRNKWYKGIAALIWLALAGLISFGLNFIPISRGQGLNGLLLTGGVLVLGLLAWTLWRNYLTADLSPVPASRADWTRLWFWAILTHPLLDAFTPYGTQLFQPFLNNRVAFNTISVVDPLYTVPFLFCLLAASFLSRQQVWRRRLNLLGIGISCAYLLFTVYHKQSLDRIFESSLNDQGINYSRYTTSPTILNNILWQGVAESDSVYFYGRYSFLEKDGQIEHFTAIPKHHEWVAPYSGQRDLEVLKWFSNGYYNIIRRKDGKLQLNDLRFGGVSDRFEKETDYVFRFILAEKGGQLKGSQTREGNEINGAIFQKFLDRVLARDGTAEAKQQRVEKTN